MYRIAEQKLEQWYRSRRRKPLVIRGARQVGKSTLVRRFARARNLPLAEVNLEKQPQLNAVFETKDIERILQELEGVVRHPISADHLLFLDEIQATPQALAALRYFFEERPELAVVCAGSLLEFALSDAKWSMPVGRVTYLNMGPMTIEEFLLALDEEDLLQHIRNYTWEGSLPETVHERLLVRQRQFCFTGGLPEAVLTYVESGSLEEVSQVQDELLESYRDDFYKYGNQADQIRLRQVMEFAARNAGTKIKYRNISQLEQSRTLKRVIELLCNARVVSRCFHTHGSGVPLFGEIDERVYKLLFLDVGLLNRICGLDWRHLASLDRQQFVNQGTIAEQFVGQHLLFDFGGLAPTALCYWLREGKGNNAEVDYLVSHGPWVIPVEVKAGPGGRLRSLHQFLSMKHGEHAVRFDLNLPSSAAMSVRLPGKGALDYHLHSLPLYMAGELTRLLDQLRDRFG
ncbi:MAG: AAA family ATPase [Acidobacteriota bacterium]|nr:AAA family ATPase [Acidobacteriota bacterium]